MSSYLCLPSAEGLCHQSQQVSVLKGLTEFRWRIDYRLPSVISTGISGEHCNGAAMSGASHSSLLNDSTTIAVIVWQPSPSKWLPQISSHLEEGPSYPQDLGFTPMSPTTPSPNSISCWGSALLAFLPLFSPSGPPGTRPQQACHIYHRVHTWAKTLPALHLESTVHGAALPYTSNFLQAFSGVPPLQTSSPDLLHKSQVFLFLVQHFILVPKFVFILSTHLHRSVPILHHCLSGVRSPFLCEKGSFLRPPVPCIDRHV